MDQVDPNPNQRKNKDFPNIQETRLSEEMEDNRYLEGDGEKPYLESKSIQNDERVGNQQKTNDKAKKLYDR